jgi:uncharacterized protein (DUF1778 family)
MMKPPEYVRDFALFQARDNCDKSNSRQTGLNRLLPDNQEGEPVMTTKTADLLPSAKDLMRKIALTEAEKASEDKRNRSVAEAEKTALIEQLSKPSGVSDEEGIRRAVTVIERAASNGLTEIQVFRFPNLLCTDRGRAINQQEAGWEKTLTGVPKEIYELWARHFRDRGYKLRVQIIDFPGGMQGDVGMTLSWS